MKKIRLFHFCEKSYTHIIKEIERSKRKKILQHSLTVYAGIGRFAALSADEETSSILKRLGCHELSQESTMLNAIVREPDVFRYCYGNKDLVQHLN